jgi:EpsI family protein
VLGALKLDDYLLADYRKPGEVPVNFYVAWYASQRMGASPHSPRVCIPGGGWEIGEFGRASLPTGDGADPLRFNRAIIAKGEHRQLVYYWFQGRGRSISNEFEAKWHLLQGAVLDNRTDGALVRVTTPIGPLERVEAADQRLQDFIRVVFPMLPTYIPD